MPYIDDFAFTGHGDTLLAARDDAQVDLGRPDGTRTAVLTATDGLPTPTPIAVHGNTVCVPGAAHLTNKGTNLLLGRPQPLSGRGASANLATGIDVCGVVPIILRVRSPDRRSTSRTTTSTRH